MMQISCFKLCLLSSCQLSPLCNLGIFRVSCGGRSLSIHRAPESKAPTCSEPETLGCGSADSIWWGIELTKPTAYDSSLSKKRSVRPLDVGCLGDYEHKQGLHCPTIADNGKPTVPHGGPSTDSDSLRRLFAGTSSSTIKYRPSRSYRHENLSAPITTYCRG